jgi:hypothetical protein
MSKVTVTVKTERVFRLPMLPNYLVTPEGQSEPIQSLTQEQLEEIGRQWTKALMAKARDKLYRVEDAA